MMNPLIQAYLKCVGGIRIVHSLPGRVRVAIGGVRQYPELAAKFAGLFRDRVLKRPAGRDGRRALPCDGEPARALRSRQDVRSRDHRVA